MSFSKVVDTAIFTASLLNSSQRMPLSGTYSGATLSTVTALANPLRGTLLWDECIYTITGVTVAGGATGGSYTITLETDAVMGYTALPIASVILGPNHVNGAAIIMDNNHHCPGSPLPTHVQMTQGSTGLCSFTINAVAKQYRGTLGTAGNRTSERVLQGSLLGNPGPGAGTITTITTDTTFVLGRTDTDIGMGKMRLWDNAFFWAVGNSATTGTWDVDIVGRVGGATTTLARTGTAGTITALWDKKPLINQFYGCMVNPTHVIVTEVSAGTIAGLEVVGIAKGGRGTQAKR